MSSDRDSLGSDYFTRLYESDPDPWRFATSAYEKEKYRATLDALPGASYGNCLDVGSSIGVLTQLLASRCGTVLGIDPAPNAVADAKLRCRALASVQFEVGRVPEDWPEGTWDLIVCSEVLYYLSESDLGRVARHASQSLAHGGDLVLAHWIGETDYPLTGDAAADGFMAAFSALRPSKVDARRGLRTDRYRLDVLRCS